MIGQPSVPASGDGLTIYGVLAERTRSHSRRFLAIQAAVCTSGAALLASEAQTWWPLAALLAAVAAYSVWGLVDAAERTRGHSQLLYATKLALATLATAAALAAGAGAALAAFAGDAPGPYGMCYDAAGRAFACDTSGMRR